MNLRIASKSWIHIISGSCWNCYSVLGLYSWAFYCRAVCYTDFMDVCQLLDNWDIVCGWRYEMAFSQVV